MAGNNNRTVHPRFLVFCASVFILLIAVVLLAVAVKYGSSMCSTGTRCGGSPDALAIGSTVIDPGGAQENPPEQSGVNQSDASIIPDPPALSESTEYPVVPAEEAKPANFGFTYEIRKNNREETYTENPNENALSFGSAKSYTGVKGITTFAGNHYRNGFAYGTATITMQTMEQVWSYAIGSANGFAGASWTGQPLIVTWEQPTLAHLGVKQEYRDREKLNEVILCGADGNIYFLELETGSRTREPIAINAPMFGTPTLDPSGAPMLYIGKGTKEDDNKTSTYAVNLIANTFETIVSGKDHTARRSDWAAFDSSPLMIDDMLIWPGESGVLYLVRMNTKYDAESGSLSVEQGDRIKYRYNGTGYSSTTFAGKRSYGFESSAAAFRNNLYLTDNGGRLQCINLNTLKLQFVADVGGDSDATPVLEEDGNAGTVFVYTCSQCDTQEETLPNGYGYCYVRKFNALTGEKLWEQRQICITIGGAKGGSKATPHIGHGTIGDLLICAFYGLAVDTTDADGNVTYTYGGKIVAYDRETGAVRWEIKQTGNADYVSSPLVVYNARGDAYLVACDRDGCIKLYNAARPGDNALFALDLGERIDATPVAFGNYVVVATTGSREQTRLFCMKLS
ncbi:MAG: PQQ-binding-like beta-propeller repeat protein [Clostridia bacterium]|jgi:outer membrane protein assembly factor BamB|nr:PQQ-binding-like beta-propeller repeat protein [Clostridia bacterium]